MLSAMCGCWSQTNLFQFFSGDSGLAISQDHTPMWAIFLITHHAYRYYYLFSGSRCNMSAQLFS